MFVFIIISIFMGYITVEAKQELKLRASSGAIELYEDGVLKDILPVSHRDNRAFAIRGNYIYCLLLKDNERWLVMIYDITKEYEFYGSYRWSGRGQWCCKEPTFKF